MTQLISRNAQAILLLTAPLIVGRNTESPELLTPGEYKRLARHLREMQRQPADLVEGEAADLLRACGSVVDEGRLRRLLGRGFLLGQAIERWQTRAIWVISRADADYPRRLKTRLREDAPAVLYGCGDAGLLEAGGLAVVGSRHVDEALIEYTLQVGHLAARAGSALVSGGAKGIDQAAMRGALEAGGRVCGVLADSLEKTAMNREHRSLLIEGQLVLVSPYDPGAGFNIGNAMQRNKLIYALADAALVVSSDLGKGGTWTGATEQLNKLRLVPVYVRATGTESEGLRALQGKGAMPWPEPQDAGALEAILAAPATGAAAVQEGLALPLADGAIATGSVATETTTSHMQPNAVLAKETEHDGTLVAGARQLVKSDGLPTLVRESEPAGYAAASEARAELSPPEVLYATVRELITRLLTAPMKEGEIAAALGVSASQAKSWLQRLVEEGVLEKRSKKPAGYALRQSLF